MPVIDKNSKVGSFLSHVLPGVVRPMRVLWNEVFGFLFLVFTVFMTSGAIRAYRAGDSKGAWIAGGFAALLLYFGVTSFLRARKISRS
jgi:hypothetical protein